MILKTHRRPKVFAMTALSPGGISEGKSMQIQILSKRSPRKAEKRDQVGVSSQWLQNKRLQNDDRGRVTGMTKAFLVCVRMSIFPPEMSLNSVRSFYIISRLYLGGCRCGLGRVNN